MQRFIAYSHLELIIDEIEHHRIDHFEFSLDPFLELLMYWIIIDIVVSILDILTSQRSTIEVSPHIP